ncbi:porin [Pseudothauera nasutitermitis]|nr:porin [Pseudothauera nasutitermitis]
MQKKLIALAVAGLVSAPAFAQSNVTVYGLVDVGFSNLGGSSTHKNRSGIDSGLQSGSRIGFRGVEDLGNGLKVAFVLEQGLNVDRNTSGGLLGGSTNRQSYLALVGNFGTFAFGRQYTPQHTFFDSIDPFNTGTVGNVENLYATGVNSAVGADLGAGAIRLDNVVAYVSPDFGGLTVTAAYTANGLADESATEKNTKSTDAKVWAINPVYKNGPLLVGLNYHRITIDSLDGTSNNDAKNSVWDLGGAYDFGAVRLSALYGKSKLSGDAIDTLGIKNTQTSWLVGATIPVSEAGKVLVSYIKTELDYSSSTGLKDRDAKKFSIGYTHDLSKRTNLYAAYAKLSSDKVGDDLAFDSVFRNESNYKRGINIGLRHKF